MYISHQYPVVLPKEELKQNIIKQITISNIYTICGNKVKLILDFHILVLIN